MPATSFSLGRNAKLYYSETPSTALASLTLIIDQAQDVELDLGRSGSTSIASRASAGWAEEAPGLRTCQITFTVVQKPTTDAAVEALEDAYLTDAELTIMALTDAKTVNGARGIRGNFTVESFKRSENLNDPITIDITLKLSQFLEWHVISA